MYDVFIIGGGPAGMTAAIYAARANLKVAMIERNAPGGQMINTYEIENYTGFTTISGPDLSMNMFNQTQAVGVEYLFGDVLEVKDDGTKKVIITSDEKYEAKTVIIATGTIYRKLNIPGEQELSGRGISWCAVCDGAFFRDQDVVVIGGGNAAVEESMYLVGLVKSVTIIHRRDELRADKHAQGKIFANKKVKVEWNSIPVSFNGAQNGVLDSVTVQNVKTGDFKNIAAKGAFIYIGSDPVSSMVRNLGVTDNSGYVITNELMETSVPGVFAAGDVREKNLRQIVTATGDGAIAANSAIKYIENLDC